MDCGQECCRLIDVFIENSDAAKPILQGLKGYLSAVPELKGPITDFIREYSNDIIAAAFGSFRIWKWWVYRETQLHKRLAEYMVREQKKLALAHRDTVNAIVRPNRGGSPVAPLFAVDNLKKILRRRDWEPALKMTGSLHAVDRQLDKAATQISNRIQVTEKSLDSLHKQRAQALSIRATIAATRASRQPSNRQQRIDFDYEALSLFRQSLRVTGNGRDLWSLECMAHQYKRLGHLDEALRAYEELEALLPDAGRVKNETLICARARKCRAEIIQRKRIDEYENGLHHAPAAGTAYALLTNNNTNNGNLGALILRQSIDEDFRGWDLIDQADLHYLTAFVAHKHSFGVVENQNLLDALSAYNGVISQTPYQGYFIKNSIRMLRQTALEGRERVVKAQNNSTYDENFLLPPPKPYQQEKLKPVAEANQTHTQ